MESSLGPDSRRSSTWPAEAPVVLIVDDDELSRLLIDATLDELGLQNPRLHAEDGDRAVEMMRPGAAGTSAPPALVMLDGRMPGRTGLDVLHWMRDQPTLARVPVVMLTGVSDVESIRSAYDSGAASYLVKPVAYQALADVLRGLRAPWILL